MKRLCGAIVSIKTSMPGRDIFQNEKTRPFAGCDTLLNENIAAVDIWNRPPPSPRGLPSTIIFVTFAAVFRFSSSNTRFQAYFYTFSTQLNTIKFMFRKTSFLLAALLCSAVMLFAQADPPKYGHMNLGNLLDGMPQTRVAEDSLRVFAASLAAKDSTMTLAFQTAYVQLQKEYKEGSLTQVQVQERQATLEKQRQEIQEYEAQAQKDLEAKRAELLSPILARIDEAIKAVAKENGFMMIFDVSTGSMLFASETIDVTPLVKKKLGL